MIKIDYVSAAKIWKDMKKEGRVRSEVNMFLEKVDIYTNGYTTEEKPSCALRRVLHAVQSERRKGVTHIHKTSKQTNRKIHTAHLEFRSCEVPWERFEQQQSSSSSRWMTWRLCRRASGRQD
jgi:hypothetical protein